MAMITMNHAAALYDARAILHDPVALQQQVDQDGYLFVRGLLPAQRLWELRADIASLLCELLWIEEDDPQALILRAGQAVLHECGSAAWRAFYDRVQCLRSFHALAHDAALRPVLTAIAGEAVFIHPRHICRLCFPQSQAFTTPPHQDYYYIGGAVDTWTAWIPIGDCPCALGSLALVPGSHKRGLLPVAQAQGAGGHATQDIEGEHWARADFQCGDVLCLHSLLIHQGQDNCSDRQLRLSLDMRFQDERLAIHPSSLEPHMQYLSWDDIYRDWPSHDPLRYYWRQRSLHIQAD